MNTASRLYVWVRVDSILHNFQSFLFAAFATTPSPLCLALCSFSIENLFEFLMESIAVHWAHCDSIQIAEANDTGFEMFTLLKRWRNKKKGTPLQTVLKIEWRVFSLISILHSLATLAMDGEQVISNKIYIFVYSILCVLKSVGINGAHRYWIPKWKYALKGELSKFSHAHLGYAICTLS